MEGTIWQGMWAAFRTWECPSLIASKKMGTSVLQKQGIEFGQQYEGAIDFSSKAPDKTILTDNLISTFWTQSRELSHAVPDFWPTELEANIFMLFYADSLW